jgi:hypothetical protein
MRSDRRRRPAAVESTHGNRDREGIADALDAGVACIFETVHRPRGSWTTGEAQAAAGFADILAWRFGWNVTATSPGFAADARPLGSAERQLLPFPRSVRRSAPRRIDQWILPRTRHAFMSSRSCAVDCCTALLRGERPEWIVPAASPPCAPRDARPDAEQQPSAGNGS